MKRVLITGVSGFIGSHALVHLRSSGFEIHGTSRQNQAHPALDQLHQVDLLDAVATAKLVAKIQPTHLLHCAWYVEHGRFWNALENIQWVESSLALLRAFHESGGERVLFTGTCAEYDFAAGWLTESITATSPSTLYGASKNSLRQLVAAYASETGLSWAWGRVFFPFGPKEGAARLIPSVIASILRGQPTRCSPGTQIRDFMHIDDVALGLVALLNSSTEGPVNICSGQPRTIREVVEQLGQILERPELVRLGDLPLGNQPPFIVGNPGRLHAEVGFSEKWDLTGALLDTVAWWRSSLS